MPVCVTWKYHIASFPGKLWEKSRTLTQPPLTGFCDFQPLEKTFQFVTCFDYLYIIFQSGHVCCFPRETMEHWNNSHQVEPRKLWQGMVSCQTNQQSILLISHTNWQNLFNIYNRWRPAVSAAEDYLCWWLGLRWLKVWRLLFRSWSILYIAFQYHHCCLVLILIGSPLIFLTQCSDLVGGTRPCKSWTWYSARSCLPCAQVNYSYACSFFQSTFTIHFDNFSVFPNIPHWHHLRHQHFQSTWGLCHLGGQLQGAATCDGVPGSQGRLWCELLAGGRIWDPLHPRDFWNTQAFMLRNFIFFRVECIRTL